MQYSFRGELDEKSYSGIEDAGVDTKGKTRLFVQQGKNNGLTSKKLVQLIKDKCRIRTDKIRDIQILDRFSFISLPFHEAEKVLAYFKKNRSGSGLLIEKAKKGRGKK